MGKSEKELDSGREIYQRAWLLTFDRDVSALPFRRTKRPNAYLLRGAASLRLVEGFFEVQRIDILI
jgi:hypothetical protein